MNTPHYDVDWVLRQLTTARWHLDRAAARGAEAARQDVATARVACENIVSVLPAVTMDAEQLRRVRAELVELEERVRAMQTSSSD